MNIDLSYNYMNRRVGDSGGGGGGGGDGNREDRNGNTEYERFHLNQYYNAVEDEQTNMDEYTSLIHRYSDFIMNSNVMFSRMEQTLRENLTRCIVRQHFYYHQYDQLRRSRGITGIPSPVGNDASVTAPTSSQITTAATTATAATAATRWAPAASA